MRELLDRVPIVRRRQVRRVGALTTASALIAALVGLGVPADATGFQTQAMADTPTDTNAPATFRIASFNLLGAGHTAPGGNRPGWASGWTRMGWAVQLIDEERLDVVGFQEMQSPQYRRFREEKGTSWGVYPGNQLSDAAMNNSIAWRKGEWSLVEKRSILIPYFDGHKIRMPYVLLKNVETGRRAWFFNTHNPANARGPAQRWRDMGFRIEADLVNRLRTEYPTVPVFATGDKNDREEYFCPIVRNTELQAANGGWSVPGDCSPPEPMRVDWVTGTEDVTFTEYEALNEGLITKTTDHALIMGTVNMPAPEVATSPIRRVLVLSVEGLAPRAITRYGEAGSPAIHRMMAGGAFTLNARTEVERTGLLANAVGMLTGRRVDPANGGHGVGWNAGTDETVHTAAGHYVSSAFDLVHNLGRRTAYLGSNPQLELVDQSWDSVDGGLDPFGIDNGRDKISKYVTAGGDGGVATELRTMLQGHPPTLTVAHLSDLDDAGHQFGWLRPGYRDALLTTDHRVGRILNTIKASPTLAGHTLVVLTSEHGGSGHDHADRTKLGNYKVPFMVMGPGVPAGASLYAMNPQYSNPGPELVGYNGAPPIRNGFVANLVTMALGMPSLPGSEFNARQDFTVFQ